MTTRIGSFGAMASSRLGRDSEEVGSARPESTLFDYAHRPAIDEGADILDDVGEIPLIILLAHIAQVGRDHYVFHAPERMVERQRLDIEHVKAGARDAAFIEGGDQRFFLDNRAARRVDNIGG